MDSDFMTNLNNMLKNGNIPNDVKEKLNSFISNNSDNTNNANTNSNENGNGNNFSNTSNSNSSNSINPEMLQNIMKFFNNSNFQGNSNTNNDVNQSSSMPNIDMNTLLKMKSIMDKMNNSKNDPRANLLLSLKPYLKESRKSKVEQYVQLINMTKIMEVFNENGGEKIKWCFIVLT